MSHFYIEFVEKNDIIYTELPYRRELCMKVV